MRRTLYAGIVSLALCGCSINREFVAAVDATWQVIGPRYCKYVEADEALDEQSKETRLRTAQILTETIEEAKK